MFETAASKTNAFKKIVRLSSFAVAIIALTAPTTRLYAAGPTPPSVVTGTDPQPTGEAMRVLLILPSLVVL